MRLGLGISIPGTSGLVQPAAFSPLDLSPVLWLDASDTSTITEVGGAVSQWDDKSGNGNDVVQATAALQPTTGTRTLNGLNVLDFTSDALANALTISQPNTVFVVAQRDAAIEGLLLSSSSPGVYFYYLANLNMYTNDGVNLSTAINVVTTDPTIWRRLANSTSSAIHRNGVSVASGNSGTNTWGEFKIGTSGGGVNAFDGIFAEIIVVDGTLTAGEIADTEQYLADKWGITI